ncbi:uncharacterized protein G2W53_011813 [Senna tora]|uniref:Uncharacterized protein n=1 Tax=Senna tora TaxID=362788 RepID=A0A834U0N7_9FABA|nr:uncharacterized protein G2W53_011813 [Senna tora]
MASLGRRSGQAINQPRDREVEFESA